HDHKFDAISAADYYGVSGILRSSRRVIQPTDPRSTILNHNTDLVQQMYAAENELVEHAIYNITNDRPTDAWLVEVIEKLKSNADLVRSIDSPDHPLAWMVPFTKPNADAAWREFANVSRQASTAHDAWLQES